MCCKNECLKVCLSRVLQGHNSNVCLFSPRSLLLSLSLLLWWLSWGSRNHRSIMASCSPFRSAFYSKGPTNQVFTKCNQDCCGIHWGFFAGILFPLDEAPGVHPSTPALKLLLPQGFFTRQSSSRKTTMTRTKWLSYLMDSILNKQPVKETGRSLEGSSPCW